MKEEHSESELMQMQMQAQTLFVLNQHDRLVQINEIEPDAPAPRLYVSVGKVSYRCWLHENLPDGIIRSLDAMLKDGVRPGVMSDLSPTMQPCIEPTCPYCGHFRRASLLSAQR